MKQHQSRNATYLGVTIDEHLKRSDHIERIVCKANSVNAFLRRNKTKYLLLSLSY